MNMVVARQMPWNGVGTLVENAMTAAEAIELGNLDWNVELHDMFVNLEGSSFSKVPNRFAVVRDSDKFILGDVGQRYVPFQNREAFAFADSLVKDGRAQYEAVGSSRNGRVVFLTMRLDVEMNVDGEDPHDMYVMLRTSHDGSKAIGVYLTPIRISCTNMVSFAIKNAKHKWSMPHVSTLEARLAEAKETLLLSQNYAEEFVHMGTTLVNTRVTDDMLVQLLEDTLPHRPKTADVIDAVMDNFRNSPTNPYHGTGWGAFNALTEYTDHGREVHSQEAVMANLFDGEIAAWRNKLVTAILAR